MKQLLMMTTAIGLCLAAPAFAQTMDSQPRQAAPAATPSTNASPAPDNQRNSNTNRGQSNDGAPRSSASGNGSPNAQAPASSGRSQPATGDQNQSGQAQNQQQPSSRSSAQSPASSNPPQSATGNQNQRQQGNAATNNQAPADRQRSSTSNQNQNQGGQAQQDQQRQRQDVRQDARQDRQDQRQDAGQDRRDNRQDARQDRRDNRQDARGSNNERVSASVNVNINDNQRSRIASVISTSRVRPVNVNFRVATGVVVPNRITLNALPADIVSIVPQYRGYRYFVTGEQIVIVEPARKTIVAVIPAGGNARAQAPAAGRVTFSDQQRQAIRSRASTMRSPVTTGSSSQILIEQEVPETIELEEFPAEIVTEVPTIRTYRYFRQDNDVVVVDPTQRRVIEIIR